MTPNEGDLLWRPSSARMARSRVRDYMAWLARTRGVHVDDYEALWHWSVTDIESFWGSLWEYFDILTDSPYQRVLDRKTMPGVRWFEGARLNYAEHLLRHETLAPAAIALQSAAEDQAPEALTWAQLGSAVRALATALRARGVRPGDRVVACLPNCPEAVIAMMATIAIGAVWASGSPEFGVRTLIDRFAQIEPVVCFAADGYRYGGREFTRTSHTEALFRAVPSLRTLVWVRRLSATAHPPAVPTIVEWSQALATRASTPFEFERVPSNHPLWIVFSSGTTGPPKAIVHGHAGMLLEHLKLMALHMDLHPGHVLFFYTTTGWMMWNVVIAALLMGTTAVLYDGDPLWPGPDRLWQIAAAANVTHMGASPSLIQLMRKLELTPKSMHDLSRIECVTVSGSPCSPEMFAWLYEHVGDDLWVNSQSGGTEICSGFVGATPIKPVYAGEIQARMLGMHVESWDEHGESVVGRVGELIVRDPCPSMPLHFWGDADGSRYRATYFSRYPGVWRHGDFLKLNARGGAFVYGRSDATLNRFGVRIGTAEIYRCLERVPEIADSLVVCCQYADGSFLMPLFVQLRPGITLDQPLEQRVRTTLREECSPRHVPDLVVQVPAIPYTLTGKKLEVPVQRLLLGAPESQVVSRDAMLDPDALDAFVSIAHGGLSGR